MPDEGDNIFMKNLKKTRKDTCIAQRLAAYSPEDCRKFVKKEVLEALNNPDDID